MRKQIILFQYTVSIYCGGERKSGVEVTVVWRGERVGLRDTVAHNLLLPRRTMRRGNLHCMLKTQLIAKKNQRPFATPVLSD